MFNLIQAARYNEGILRLLGMNQDAAAPQLASEIQAVMDILNPPPEIRYLIGERLCHGTVAGTGAAAAKNAFVNLYNITGSGRLVIVDRFIFLTVTAMFFKWGFKTGLVAGALGNRGYRDSRLGTTVSPSTELSSGNDVGAGFGPITAGFGACGANADRTIEGPFILGPGDSLTVVAQTVNLGFTFTVEWRERALFASER